VTDLLLDTELREYRKFLVNLTTSKHQYEDKLSRLDKEISSLDEKHAELCEARDVMNIVGTLCQDRTKGVIEFLVSQALEAVFGPEYSFEVENKVIRNQPEMYFYVVISGKRYSLKEELGGGVIDLVSFILRVVLWSITTPRTRPTIILDEPGKFISRDKQEVFGEMIKVLSEMLGIQFIIITHEDVLEKVADVAYFVEQKRGVSNVRRLR